MRMVCLISGIRTPASGSETRRESVTVLDGETEIQENKKRCGTRRDLSCRVPFSVRTAFYTVIVDRYRAVSLDFSSGINSA